MIQFSGEDRFLVTGANSGIGKAIAHKIIGLGGTVIAVARDVSKLEHTKFESLKPDNFNIESKNLSEDIDGLPLWIGSIVEKYGKLTGYVHSAGVQETMPFQVAKTSKAKELFDINYFSAISIIKGFAKKTNNKGSGSSIVLISSFVSHLGLPATVSYSASKGAVNSAVKVLASELAKEGIRINAVLPGHVQTNLLSGSALNENFLNSLKPKYPLGLGFPEDVANLVCFLLSDSARWITGSEYVIDGGASIQF